MPDEIGYAFKLQGETCRRKIGMILDEYKEEIRADLIKEIESKSISGTYVDGNTYLPHEFKYEQIKIIKESDWQKIKPQNEPR